MWEPLLDLRGPIDAVTVSASDVGHREEACRAYLAFKIRRGVQATAWQPIYGNLPFVLRPIREIIAAAHAARDHLTTFKELAAFIDGRIRLYPTLHRALHLYVRAAVENYIDAHDTIEQELGRLSASTVDPSSGTDNRQLTAWGFSYEGSDGTYEFRRMRMGSAHVGADAADVRYALLAAQVIAQQRGRSPKRIRVVEVGLGDGSISVIADASPAEIRDRFAHTVRPAIYDFLEATAKRPGFECGNCKIAGCCEALIPLPGILGQEERGVASRSVSASDLRIHATCPTQYLLAKVVHVPRDLSNQTEAQTRGELVHRWLKYTHTSLGACSSSSLLSPDEPLVHTGPLDATEYAIAYPYLLWHVQDCLLDQSDLRLVSVDEPLYGFDNEAQVVVVSKPDLVAADGTTLVIRETKTTDKALPQDEAAAFDQYFDVAWLLSLGAGGLAAHFDCSDTRVDLEIIAPSERRLYQWGTEESAVLSMSKGEVSRRVDAWHVDDAWLATPGPHCGWCPVRDWCPDADTGVPRSAPPPEQAEGPDDVPDF